MSIEQQFIDAINAEQGQGHRLAEYVYADWLEDQGDPRGEAWRVMLEGGKSPSKSPTADAIMLRTPFETAYFWWFSGESRYTLTGSLKLDTFDDGPLSERLACRPFRTFHAAMDAAAVAWVRCHRDPEYMTAAEAELLRQAQSLPVYDGPADPVPIRSRSESAGNDLSLPP